MLEIPHIGAAPRTWRLPGPQAAAARTALALLDHGALPPDTAAVSPAQLVKAGLRRWLEQHAGTMHTMRLRMSYDEHQDAAAITIALDMGYALRVGERLTLLQNAIEGFGETVLWHLQHDLPDPFGIVTPATTLDFARNMQWGGFDDETEQVQLLLGEGEKRKDIHILTRAQFDRRIPGWATDPKEHQKPKALADIAKHWRRPRLVRQVAAAVLALHEVRGHWVGREDDQRIWPPAQVLLWKANDDVTIPLCDDYGNMMFESGEAIEDFAELELKAADPWSPTLAEFLSGLEPMLRTLRAVDRVLQLIGKPIRG